MSKWLTSSAKTGEKIINNQSIFSSNFIKADNDLYKFEWEFDGQHGYANIIIKDAKVSSSSLLNTNSNSTHKFSRPLGLYNDNTLLDVFKRMMYSIGISVTGVYSEF
ncbi:hypothetical protein [Clostridium estertheticum]|uniref:hypothetical protein n=1 Tax=Clostridium estertheticum TaxID=238834 RepID=UPI001C6F3866|nr:hypothetical protein [Clostridium estertheticum]MBW9154833.1 hypothetical protein [Clostridium estertheticum]WLC85815.1 hypothetical protein KTC97_08755 [Clostridium estertheticum]